MTNKNQSVAVTSVVGAALLSIALPASAASWQPYVEETTSPSVILSDSDTGGNVLLACGEGGKITSLIATSSTPIIDLLSRNTPYSRKEAVTIRFADAAPLQSDMRYIPAANLLESRSYTIGAKLFNAAIRKESISVVAPGGKEFIIDLPAPDDAFKAFAESCAEARAE